MIEIIVMDESIIGSEPQRVGDAVGLDGLARAMVTALDRIIDRLIMVAPTEGFGGDVPLTLQEVRATKAIPPEGSVSMSSLASSIGVTLPTATHLVDRLAAKGVVVRTRPEYDRRLVLVALSDQSKAHQRAFFENRVGLSLSILEPFDPTAREQAVRALGEIARMIQSQAAGQAGRRDTQ
jgi:DNA-binding MarR family transcriptional regulator